MSARADMEKVERFREAIEAGNYEKLPEHERDEALEVHLTMSLLMQPSHIGRSIVKALKSEHDLGQATAYRRIEMAKLLIGDLTKSNREVDKHLLYLRAEDNYRKALHIRDNTKDDELKLAAIDKVDKSIQLMAKIKGFDRPDDMTIDPAKLEASIYNTQLPGFLGKVVKAIAAEGLVDLDITLKKLSPAALRHIPEAELEEDAKGDAAKDR